MEFGFGDKIAPRLGCSYDVFGNGRASSTAAGAATTTGRSTSCRAARSAATSGACTTAPSTIRTIRSRRTCATCRAAICGRVAARAATAACRTSSTIDPDIKPMSQDSFSAGFDFELNPRTVATVTYVHNNLIRTIEDIGALVERQRGLHHRQSRRRPARRSRRRSFAPLTPVVHHAEAEAAVRRARAGVSRRFCEQLVRERKLTISRLYGNYAGCRSSDEIRTPTTGVASATAQQQAGSDVPPGRQREPRVGLDEQMFDAHGNLDVRSAAWRPIVRTWSSSTAHTTSRGTRRSARSSMPAAARR